MTEDPRGCKSIVVTARLDVRWLATLAKNYQKRYKLPRTRSEFISNIVQDFCELLIKHGLVKMCESTQEAVNILENFGFYFRDKSGEYQRRLAIQIQREALVEDFGDDSYLDEIVLGKNKENENG